MLNHNEIAILEQANEILSRHNFNGIGIDPQHTSDHYKQWLSEQPIETLIENSNLQILCMYFDKYSELFKELSLQILLYRHNGKIYADKDSLCDAVNQNEIDSYEQITAKVMFTYHNNKVNFMLSLEYEEWYFVPFYTRTGSLGLQISELDGTISSVIVNTDIIDGIFIADQHNADYFFMQLTGKFREWISVRPLVLKAIIQSSKK